jgi:sugar/nucleoside kinase (ribokinase family)
MRKCSQTDKEDVVDTTGAGDAFAAGVLAGLLPFVKQSRAICDLDKEDYYKILRLANAVGALVTTERGVIPSLPTKGEVEALTNGTIFER